ncbi:MAG: cytidine deaminase [Oscillospiraceae bacterium]|nr:cytidine deaminase [Oscillospiraceae bacterium]
MTDRDLLNRAVEAMANAYAPYSHFPVGAAIECDDGSVVTGCNVENAALGSTICAERSAVCAAVSQGRRRFRRIAIASSGPEYCMPCGTCRQVLQEFAPELEVLCARNDGRYVSYRLSDLLPHAFDLGGR